MSFAVNLLVFSEGARIVENFSAIFVVAGVFFLGMRVEGFDKNLIHTFYVDKPCPIIFPCRVFSAIYPILILLLTIGLL